MTDIILSGCCGKMGKVIANAVAERDDCRIVAGVDIFSDSTSAFPIYDDFSKITQRADVIIDFSHPAVLDSLLTYAVATKTPCVICTTGFSAQQVEAVRKSAQSTAVFYSRNMSLGINLLIELSKMAEKVLGKSFDVEIIEKHHNQKIDAPSGTALMIADGIAQVMPEQPQYVYDRHTYRKKREQKEIGIHAVRGGTIVGEHEVIFAGHDEVLTITHQAQSKEVFAVGSINAGIYLHGKACGMYDMSDMLQEK